MYGNATNKGLVRKGFCKLLKQGGLKIDTTDSGE